VSAPGPPAPPTPEPSPEPPWPAAGPRVVPPEVFGDDGAAPRLREALAPLLPLYVLDILTAFTVGMLPPILPLVAEEFALSAAGVGLINAIYAVGRLAGAYPASRIRARSGTRVTLFVGLGGLVVGSVGCGLAPAFPILLLARLIMGFGASAVFLALFAELIESAAPAWRGRLANAFEGTAILSLAVTGILAAVLGQVTGWRTVFGAAGLVTLFCFPVARALEPQAGRREAAAAAGARWASAAAFRSLASVYVACLAMSMTWSGLFATLGPILGHDQYGLPTTAIGLALSAGYVAELVGLIGVGLIVDRVRREPLFTGGALSVTAGGLVLALGAHPAWFVVGLALVGGGFAVWMIPATVLVDRAGTPLPPGHLALYRIAIDAGMIVGPLALGLLATAAGDRWAAGMAGFVMVAGAWALGRRPGLATAWRPGWYNRRP
jgi:predicted MFS family arabinose efflux permease